MQPYPLPNMRMPLYAPTPIPTYSNIPTSLTLPKSKLQPKPPRKPANGSSDESDWDSGSEADEGAAEGRIQQALQWFNDATEEQLVEVLSTLAQYPKSSLCSWFRYVHSTACTPVQATSIIDIRPFESEDQLRKKLQRKKGVSPRYFDDYIRILEGYESVDSVIAKCERVGKELSDILAIWASVADTDAEASTSANGVETGSATPTDAGGVSIVAVDVEAIQAKAEAIGATDAARSEALKGYMSTQPSLLAEGVQLKDYQLLGVNWLALLHRRNLSCILADEMGICTSLILPQCPI